MDSMTYDFFTQVLTQNLEALPTVQGLVALGSMAQQSHLPDEWSDHDFFVIVESGQQEDFRQALSWLPDAEQIVFYYRETAHGLKVFYAEGHLLEFAVFDEAELAAVKVNDYQVLLDKTGRLEGLMARLQKDTAETSQAPDDHFLFGQLLGHVLVGVGRYARGEKISAHIFVKHYAITDILSLIAKHIDTPHHSRLDNLDPLRRFEQAYPDLGAEVNAILALETPQTAWELLRLMERLLAANVTSFPTVGFAMAYRYIEAFLPA